MIRTLLLGLLLTSTARADFDPPTDINTPLGTLIWDGETATGGFLTTVGGKLNLVYELGSGNSWRDYKLPSTIFDSDWSIQVPVYLEAGHLGELHLSINDRFDDVVWAQGRLDVWLQSGWIKSNWQPDRLTPEPFAVQRFNGSSVVLGVDYDADANTFTTVYNSTIIETVDASQWSLGSHVGVTLWATSGGPTSAGRMYFGPITALPRTLFVPEATSFLWLGVLLLRRALVN